MLSGKRRREVPVSAMAAMGDDTAGEAPIVYPEAVKPQKPWLLSTSV